MTQPRDPTGAPDPERDEGPTPAWRRRLQQLARARSPSPRVRGALMLVAGLAVAAGVVWSLATLDIGLADLRPAWVAVLVIAISPATIWANAAELRVMTRIVAPGGRAMGWLAALRTVLVATAANLLPLPAGAVVRIQAMRAEGVTTARATSINVVGAGAWVSAGLLVAGLAALGAAPLGAIGLALAVAAAGLATTVVLTSRLTTIGTPRAVGQLLAVETATALIHGVRLVVVLLALGIDVSLRQGLVLGAATPLAAAAGIFPSGIGLAEALTAVIAPLVALPAAAGFAATAFGRVVGLLVMVPLALAIGARDIREARRLAAAGTVTPG